MLNSGENTELYSYATPFITHVCYSSLPTLQGNKLLQICSFTFGNLNYKQYLKMSFHKQILIDKTEKEVV